MAREVDFASAMDAPWSDPERQAYVNAIGTSLSVNALPDRANSRAWARCGDSNIRTKPAWSILSSPMPLNSRFSGGVLLPYLAAAYPPEQIAHSLNHRVRPPRVDHQVRRVLEHSVLAARNRRPQQVERYVLEHRRWTC
jgi:hypothetical protein